MQSNLLLLDMHNKYLMLLLEKLTVLEGTIVVKEEPVVRPARLDPRLLHLSKQDKHLIAEALSKPSIVLSQL